MNEDLQERLYYRKNSEDPSQIVLGFVRAMGRWEVGCVRDQKLDRDGLEKIFAIYCTPRDRKYAQRVHFSNPPEYNPEKETVERVESRGKRAQVFTVTRFPFSHFRYYCYTLLHEEEGWLLDSKKVITTDGKENRHTL
jgi:hypothetical protein